MDACALVKPDLSFAMEVRAYRREMLRANSSMDGCGPLRRMESVADWVSFNAALENEQTVPEYWVPSEQFVYVREADGKIVGMIQFRHRFNDFLEKYGGHIGYSVRPNERRKGYAKRMLADCLLVCRAAGLKHVLITCMQDNEASRRTIIANGGIYESTVYCEPDTAFLERYWVELSPKQQ